MKGYVVFIFVGLFEFEFWVVMLEFWLFWSYYSVKKDKLYGEVMCSLINW